MYEKLANTIKSYLPRNVRQWLHIHQRQLDQESRFRNNLLQSDSFIVGHPKSGNTWTAYMFAIVLNRDCEHQINLSNIGSYIPTIHNADYKIERYKSLPAPRLFRNEAPLFPELYPRTIYLIRDPRSVLLSYYYHCVHDTGRKDWPIDSFIEEMLEHGCIRELEPYLVRWDIQVTNWLSRAKSQPVMIMKYEDLKSNQHDTLARGLEFLGIPHTPDLIDLAVRRTGFTEMRGEEKTYGAESYTGEKGSKGYFVRKGSIDSWKEEMPPGTIRKIEKVFGPVMQQIGYAPLG